MLLERTKKLNDHVLERVVDWDEELTKEQKLEVCDL